MRARRSRRARSELGAGLFLLSQVGFLLIWVVRVNSSCFRYDIFVVEQK